MTTEYQYGLVISELERRPVCSITSACALRGIQPYAKHNACHLSERSEEAPCTWTSELTRDDGVSIKLRRRYVDFVLAHWYLVHYVGISVLQR